LKIEITRKGGVDDRVREAKGGHWVRTNDRAGEPEQAMQGLFRAEVTLKVIR
jgi:hypothetical protein